MFLPRHSGDPPDVCPRCPFQRTSGFFIPHNVIVYTSIARSIDVYTFLLTLLQAGGILVRMGRKRLPDDVARRKPLPVRLSPEEQELIRQAAIAEKYPDVSKWVRECLLKRAKRALQKGKA